MSRRDARRRPAVAVAGLLLAGLVAGCATPPDEAMRTVRVWDLMAALPRASRQAPSPDYLLIRRATLGGDDREALFMHPTSSVEYPAITPGEQTVLTAFVGLDESVLDKPGDGVEFTVSVRLHDGVVVKVFSRAVDPRRDPALRGWLPVRVPLGAFAGQPVRIVLATSPGPAGDDRFDWALWSQPRLILDPM